MTIFQSVVFPDNERRAQRVFELASDCALFYQRLAAHKEQIDGALAEIDRAYHGLFAAASSTDGAVMTLEISDEWTVKCLRTVAKSLSKKIVVTALEAAAASLAVQRGAAPSAMRQLVRAPAWFLGSEIARGLTGAMIADLILSAYDGINERTRFRKMIGEMVPARQQAALFVRRNDALLEGLRAISASLTVTARTSNYKTADEAERKGLANELLEHGLDDIGTRHASIDENLIAVELAHLDRQRGSFTEEDGG